MKINTVNQPVELLAFEILPNGKGGLINVAWANTKASVFFTTGLGNDD